MSSKVSEIKRIRGLRRLLTRHGLPLEKWGVGPTKSVNQLWKEYQEGETVLKVSRGRLVRSASRVHPRIFARHKGVWYRLYEDRQVFKNQSVRHPSSSRSLSEKMLPTETPEEALGRGVREELGIQSIAHWLCLPERVVRRKVKTSESYPGLLTRHTDYRFTCIMNPRDFRIEGYEEHVNGRVTYFIWKKADWASVPRVKKPKLALAA